MRKLIQEKLKAIEKTENIRILLAVESGSRAWGFASPDSDYDVRFIYVRPRDAYLRLEGLRDVIELPISGELDINGWDIRKTLQLLYRSNPTLFEWFSSPIVYRQTPFADSFRQLMGSYYSTKKGLLHYISMAESNYREHMHSDTVKAKKYFYVLRPVLACRWILEKQTPPPMLFSELVAAELPAAMKETVDALLDLKMNSPEVKMIPRIDALNEYLDEEIASVKSEAKALKKENDGDWGRLNEVFLSLFATE